MKSILFLVIVTFILVNTNSFAMNVDCDVVETTGNTISTLLEEGLNREHVGDKIEITSTQVLEVAKISDLDFDQCMFSLWAEFNLMREILGNTCGKIKVQGKIYEIDNEHICLKELQSPKLEIPGASEIEVSLYQEIANRSLPKTQCFKW